MAVLLCGYPEILLPAPGVLWKGPPGCNCSKDPSEPFNYLVETGGFRFNIQVQQQRPGRQRKNVSPSRLIGLSWGSTYNGEPLKTDWKEKLEDSELEFLFRFVWIFFVLFCFTICLLSPWDVTSQTSKVPNQAQSPHALIPQACSSCHFPFPSHFLHSPKAQVECLGLLPSSSGPFHPNYWLVWGPLTPTYLSTHSLQSESCTYNKCSFYPEVNPADNQARPCKS